MHQISGWTRFYCTTESTKWVWEIPITKCITDTNGEVTTRKAVRQLTANSLHQRQDTDSGLEDNQGWRVSDVGQGQKKREQETYELKWEKNNVELGSRPCCRTDVGTDPDRAPQIHDLKPLCSCQGLDDKLNRWGWGTGWKERKGGEESETWQKVFVPNAFSTCLYQC